MEPEHIDVPEWFGAIPAGCDTPEWIPFMTPEQLGDPAAKLVRVVGTDALIYYSPNREPRLIGGSSTGGRDDPLALVETTLDKITAVLLEARSALAELREAS